jgi:hypothetical protein
MPQGTLRSTLPCSYRFRADQGGVRYWGDVTDKCLSAGYDSPNNGWTRSWQPAAKSLYLMHGV